MVPRPPVDERVVLVTGGGQGIGFATAQAFFKQGYKVALADIMPSVAAKARSAFNSPDRAIGVVMDVADVSSVDRAIAEVENSLGFVDILINNASIFSVVPFRSWEEVDLDIWDKIMAVNLRGPFVCARRVLPGMRGNGWGRIVNIGSSSSISGNALRIDYTSSKGGVVTLTRSLALAVGGYGVTVNCLAPGATQSEGVLQNYPAELIAQLTQGRSISRAEVPDDLVGTILFLASDAAEFMTGQTLVVDGGRTFL